MEQPITGQMLHELANQKKQELGDETASWNEVSSRARKVYNFVAEQLNKDVVIPLQKEIENRDAVHHNMIDHSEAMFNEQAKEITDLRAEVKALQALVKDWQAWAEEGVQFIPNDCWTPQDGWMDELCELQTHTKHLIGEEVKA